MKRQIAFILFVGLFAAYVFSSMLIVAGCGGGGGGGGGFLPPSTTTLLATGTFVKTVELDTGSTGDHYGVVYTDVGPVVQYLYLASDINGSGNIESITLRNNDVLASPANCPLIQIKMGHTNLIALTTTETNNYETGQGTLETVFDGPLTVPAGADGDYFTITLDVPFQYNGVDNLVVQFQRVQACDTSHPVRQSLGTGYASGYWGGSIYAVLYHTKFNFIGGDNAVSYTGTQVNWASPFTDTPGASRRVQLIYPASDIDGSGTITGIAIPVSAITSAGSFTVIVKLGHSTATELTSSGPPVDDAVFAGNYSDNPVTVVDAAILNVPAGVPAGDYVWLPLNGDVFTYKGVDSLVMEIKVSFPSGEFAWKTHTTPGTNTSMFASSELMT